MLTKKLVFINMQPSHNTQCDASVAVPSQLVIPFDQGKTTTVELPEDIWCNKISVLYYSLAFNQGKTTGSFGTPMNGVTPASMVFYMHISAGGTGLRPNGYTIDANAPVAGIALPLNVSGTAGSSPGGPGPGNAAQSFETFQTDARTIFLSQSTLTRTLKFSFFLPNNYVFGTTGSGPIYNNTVEATQLCLWLSLENV